MIQSMTGFATKAFIIEVDNNKSNVSLSLKSFNARFFEATCKQPYPLSHLEHEFIKRLKKRMVRGHIYLTIYMDNPNLFKGAVEPAMNVIEGYIKATNKIKDAYHITQDISLDHVLGLPNIFNIEEQSIDAQTEQTIFEHIDKLIDQVIITRQQEGDALKKDLTQRIDNMEKEISEVTGRSKKLVSEQKDKVNQAVQELKGDESSIAEMRKNALYAMLDKIDIHEEIVRFQSHLKSMRQQLESPTLEKGKRLDFTLQELAREINTIAAKCSDAQIGSHAINIKVEVEKAREQAQNIV
jgi:uncharacterized protein (TIGR00255 family)